ncbi:hypothetical protein EVAR_35223_1 [Eumeta japonica]|uniref:Uncharacterized protein n=1 Tax=Eumeta variegata TaxID=151549 RepID=A0A4C1VDF7_EUMVA|nr:hypothetical protein EVAR_35223_1 [Eumeta japonica]
MPAPTGLLRQHEVAKHMDTTADLKIISVGPTRTSFRARSDKRLHFIISRPCLWVGSSPRPRRKVEGNADDLYKMDDNINLEWAKCVILRFRTRMFFVLHSVLLVVIRFYGWRCAGARPTAAAGPFIAVGVKQTIKQHNSASRRSRLERARHLARDVGRRATVRRLPLVAAEVLTYVDSVPDPDPRSPQRPRRADRVQRNDYDACVWTNDMRTASAHAPPRPGERRVRGLGGDGLLILQSDRRVDRSIETVSGECNRRPVRRRPRAPAPRPFTSALAITHSVSLPAPSPTTAPFARLGHGDCIHFRVSVIARGPLDTILDS